MSSVFYLSDLEAPLRAFCAQLGESFVQVEVSVVHLVHWKLFFPGSCLAHLVYLHLPPQFSCWGFCHYFCQAACLHLQLCYNYFSFAFSLQYDKHSCNLGPWMLLHKMLWWSASGKSCGSCMKGLASRIASKDILGIIACLQLLLPPVQACLFW